MNTASSFTVHHSSFQQLENRLVLLAWLNSLVGYPSNRALLEDCKSVAEGFGPDGRSFLYHHLIARGSQVTIPAEDLARYDENIRLHLKKINPGCTERITLRYFQYLAALYTEIYLDRLFKDKAQLVADLNDFVKKRNASKSAHEPNDEPFTEGDLTKLAYWMATGSGKTIILHLNYHQFLHYYCTGKSATPPPARQYPAHHPQRGPERTAPGRTEGFGHPGAALRFEHQRRVERR
jgi:hypothetical protein